MTRIVSTNTLRLKLVVFDESFTEHFALRIAFTMPIKWKRGPLKGKPARPKWGSGTLKPRRGKLSVEQWDEIEAILQSHGEDFHAHVCSKCIELGIGEQMDLEDDLKLHPETLDSKQQRVVQKLIKDVHELFKTDVMLSVHEHLKAGIFKQV